MPRRKNNNLSLAFKSAELAMAVPQVIAHRLSRMAVAGPSPSPRDRKEFHRMGAEKVTAFSAGWNAMLQHTMRANQALAIQMLRGGMGPSAYSATTAVALGQAMQDAAVAIMGKGLAPVHRTATANARRLGGVKRRR